MVQASVDAACPPVDGQSDDMALLRRYVDLGSQEAFSEIVRRHLPWIHATCRKALGDRHTAEDAAQAVFIILARRAATISPQTRLSGWLFNTARFVVKDARKHEARYRRRENVARELANDRLLFRRPSSLDPQMQAALDDALAMLTERDRLALLMHFYEGLSLAEMADVMKISKEGAKKRVGRALSRLRTRLGAKRSVAGIAAIVLLMRSRSALAMPPGLGRAVVSAATIPGRESITAGAIAKSAMQMAAGASHRLLRAALLGELAVASLVGGVYAVRGVHRAAAPPVRVVVAAARSTPSVGSVVGSSQSKPAGSRAVPLNLGSVDSGYRSGADDTAPELTRTKPYSQGVTQALDNQAASSSVPSSSAAAMPQAKADGSTFAGLAPVSRAAMAMPALPQGSGRTISVAAGLESVSAGVSAAPPVRLAAPEPEARLQPARVETPRTETLTPSAPCPPEVASSNPAIPQPPPRTTTGLDRGGAGAPDANDQRYAFGWDRPWRHWGGPRTDGTNTPQPPAFDDPTRTAELTDRLTRMFVDSEDDAHAFAHRHEFQVWMRHAGDPMSAHMEPLAIVAGEHGGHACRLLDDADATGDDRRALIADGHFFGWRRFAMSGHPAFADATDSGFEHHRLLLRWSHPGMGLCGRGPLDAGIFEAPGAAAAATAAGAPGDSAAFAFQNVPEPGVVGLALLAAGGGLLRRRRISSARP